MLLNCYLELRQSKKISNDQELTQSDPISCPQTKREITTKYINAQQFTKGTRGKSNEQLIPRQVVIQLPKLTHIIGEPKYKYVQQEQATVRNHNRSTALERSVLKYWRGGLNRFYGIPTSPLGSAVLHYKCNINT